MLEELVAAEAEVSEEYCEGSTPGASVKVTPSVVIVVTGPVYLPPGQKVKVPPIVLALTPGGYTSVYNVSGGSPFEALSVLVYDVIEGATDG